MFYRHHLIPKMQLKESFKELRRYVMKALLYIMRIFPIDKKKILICNYYGKGFGDNGKSISLALRELGVECKIVWMVNNRAAAETLPSFVTPVFFPSIKYFYELATAKVWIDNCRKRSYVRKRKGQYYIQTWHGCIPLKRIEGDVEEELKKEYVKSARNDSKMTDLMLSDSDFCSELYRRAFWYSGDILKSGTPRLDTLFNHSEKNKSVVCRKLNIDPAVKVLLYAPTFRANHNLECYNLNYAALKEQLESSFGGKWIILVRMHPNLTSKEIQKLNIHYNEWLKNASDYEDMYELLSCSDCLITDYSSTMFEAALISTKVFLYITDYNDYYNDRGFYFDFYSLPFPIAHNNEELLKNISDFDPGHYKDGIQQFMDQLNCIENGTASKAVAELIAKKIK